MKQISSIQFAICRIVLGTYLTVHFLQLAPYGPELFGNRGVLPDPRLNFTYGILPNPLEHFDSPLFVSCFLYAMAVLAAALALGCCRRFAAVLLWFGWACLFNRNNLINNPSIPYIGLLLLLTVLVPGGEGFGFEKPRGDWHFPAMVYWTAWILMATGYSYSGLAKLRSPSWIDGSAIQHVLENPLARPVGLREFLLALPTPCLRLLTWSSLAAELFCLPLSFSRSTRLLSWSILVVMNFGILFAINFADLTIGMLIIHLFTYDPNWHLDLHPAANAEYKSRVSPFFGQTTAKRLGQ